jgi:hypothetical protein
MNCVKNQKCKCDNCVNDNKLRDYLEMVSSDDKNCENKIKYFDVRFVVDKLKEIENLSSLCERQMTQIKELEYECFKHKSNHVYLEKQLKDILNPP